MDNKEREEHERCECEREERHQAILACTAECQQRGQERDGTEKGQQDMNQSKKLKKGDKNLQN